MHERPETSSGFSDKNLQLRAAEYSDIAAGYVEADKKYTLYLYFQDSNGDILEYSRLHPEPLWVRTDKIIKNATRGTSLALVYRGTKRESHPALVYESTSHQLAVWTRGMLSFLSRLQSQFTLTVAKRHSRWREGDPHRRY